MDKISLNFSEDEELDSFLEAWGDDEDINDDFSFKNKKNPHFEKVISVVLETLGKMTEEKKILSAKTDLDGSSHKEIKVEIIGKNFMLYFLLKDDDSIDYYIHDTENWKDLNTFPATISENKIESNIRILIEKMLVKQRLKNVVNPPKKYLYAFLPYGRELCGFLWNDLIKNHTNDEIEFECFNKSNKERLSHHSHYFSYSIFKLFDSYYSVKVSKENEEYQIFKSDNKNGAIAHYQQLLADELNERI